MRRRRRLIEDLEQRFGDGGRLEGQHARSMVRSLSTPSTDLRMPLRLAPFGIMTPSSSSPRIQDVRAHTTHGATVLISPPETLLTDDRRTESPIV